MENASKAFLIAGGTLIGVMLVILIAVFFRSLSPLEREKQNQELVEQITAFNKEYEAYNKKLMYGVDLISVLNKAKSNNEKYVSGNFLSGFKYNSDYLINIKFHLKNTLNDVIIVNYLSEIQEKTENRKKIQISDNKEGQYTNGKGPNISLNGVFEISDEYKSKVNTELNTATLVTNFEISSKFTSGDYYLLNGDNNPQINESVNVLLKASELIHQTVKNPSSDVNDKIFINIVGKMKYGWSSAEWRTALYDLKTRKFKCVDEKYNEQTGRIIYMEFTEI